jgi:hypothetical protein
MSLVRTNNYLKRDKENRGNIYFKWFGYDLYLHVKAFCWLHISLIYLIIYKTLFIKKESKSFCKSCLFSACNFCLLSTCDSYFNITYLLRDGEY